MQSFRVFFIAFLLLVLNACSESPDSEEVKKTKLSACEQSISELMNSGLYPTDSNKDKIQDLYNKAEGSCSAAVKSDGSNGKAKFLHGTVKLVGFSNYGKLLNISSGDAEESMGILSSAIDLGIKEKEDLSMCYNNRGYGRYLLGLWELSRQDFISALEVNNDNKLAGNGLRQVEAKIAYLEEVGKVKEQNDTPSKYQKLCDLHSGMREWDSVLTTIREWNERYPSSYEAAVTEGKTYLAMEKRVEALEALNKAITINPNGYYAYVLRSKAWQNAEEKRTADLEKAISINPNGIDALYGLGHEYYMNGRWVSKEDNEINAKLTKAIVLLEKVISLDPKYNSDIYINLGDSYSYIDPPNWKKAVENYSKASEMSPSEDNLSRLANAYRANSQYNEAISTYNRILKNESFAFGNLREGYQKLLAKCYLQQAGHALNKISDGKIKKDNKDIQEALRILSEVNTSLQRFDCKNYKNGDFNLKTGCQVKSEILGYLGSVYEGLGDTGSAIKYFSEALEIDGYNSLYTHRALLYNSSGAIDKALEDCKKSITIKKSTYDFGSITCTEQFIAQLEKTVRFTYNPKIDELVKSTSENSCYNFQYMRNINNSVTTLSMGTNLQVSYNSKSLLSVNISKTIGDQLSFIVKEKGLQIGSDLTLPFYNWLIRVALKVNDFGTKQSDDNLVFALCYLNNLALNSKFKVMNQLFDEYAKTIQ